MSEQTDNSRSKTKLIFLILMFLLPVAGSWYLVADPAVRPVMEMGFLNGQVEPQIHIQGPDATDDFFRDVKYSRIKGVFGGTPLDWKTFYCGIA